MFSTSTLFGCNKGPSPTQTEPPPAASKVAATPPNTLQSYNNIGLSLIYPKHWQLDYDETPSIYADRGVGFNISEFSSASVYIFNQPNYPVESLTNRFLMDFNLDLNGAIEGYKRSPDKLAGFNGELITWTDTEVCCSTFEVSVYQVQNAPNTILVAFILSDEDIQSDAPYKSHFLTSIQHQ